MTKLEEQGVFCWYITEEMIYQRSFNIGIIKEQELINIDNVLEKFVDPLRSMIGIMYNDAKPEP